MPSGILRLSGSGHIALVFWAVQVAQFKFKGNLAVRISESTFKSEKAQQFLGCRAFSKYGHCPHPSNHVMEGFTNHLVGWSIARLFEFAKRIPRLFFPR
jgi:hypothetical protein